MVPMLVAQVDAVDTILETATTGMENFEDAQAAASATAAGGLLVGGMLIFVVVASLIGVAFLVWWIIQIIDLSKRDFPQKSTWMVLMILSLVFGLNWIMSIVYHFSVVKKNLGAKAA